MDGLGKQLGFKDLEDWYRADKDILEKYEGPNFLSRYGNSICLAVQAAYKEHDWHIWKFKNPPSGFWKQTDNRKKYFDWLGKHLGYNKMEDWYGISGDSILDNSGGHLLREYYGNSPSKAVQEVYPNQKWMTWRFKCPPKGYWESVLKYTREQRLVLNWLGEQLNIQRLEDWYKISIHQITELVPFGGLLNVATFTTILRNVYPTHKWNTNWLLRKVLSSPMGLKPATQSSFFDSVTKQLGIRKPEDWYSVKREAIVKYGGKKILVQYSYLCSVTVSVVVIGLGIIGLESHPSTCSMDV